MLHNFGLTNFSLLFAADFQANPTDLSLFSYLVNQKSYNTALILDTLKKLSDLKAGGKLNISKKKELTY